MRNFLIPLVLTLSVFSWRSDGQTLSKKELLSVIRTYRESHEHEIIGEYFELLSIPNVSRDRANVRKNAEFIKKMMEARGIETRILETPGNPVVYGEIDVAGAAQTLMFYVHYDGQPVDPSKWVDTEPFKPVLRPGKLEAGFTHPKPIPMPAKGEPFDKEWRIYARSASDDKAPLMAILAALDGLKNGGIPLKNNLKFIFEGEEEAGSTHLRPFCEEHKDLLESDVLFICDGPVYFSGDPTLFFGVRGITSLSITVYGANVSLHSGHYGNWAPNPAMRLAQLLATMKDGDGRVKIEGFYDSVVPLSEIELKALKAIPRYDETLKTLYGFSGAEGGGMSLNEAIQWPSLNVRGLQSGWVGRQARTIIPASATASIDVRLVKGNEPREMVQKVVDHIRGQRYHVVQEDPDGATRMEYPLIAKVTGGGGYRAARTPMDLPVSRRLIEALSGYREKDPVLLPTLGGSVPIYIFDDILEIPTIGIPIVNHDNNQHQPNENLRVGNLWTGIETFSAVIMMGR